MKTETLTTNRTVTAPPRYVIEFIDGWQFTTNKTLRMARIYHLDPLTDGWPRKSAKPLALVADNEDELYEHISFWRKVGCPTAANFAGAVEEYNALQAVSS